MSELERFWEKVNPAGALIIPDLGNCWQWEGEHKRRRRARGLQ
jgi:hypothetical protein